MPRRLRTLAFAAAQVAVATALTTASLTFQQRSTEVALYGGEGDLAENLRPRPVAGWPAPFVADSPATSVLFQIGVEDDFRGGPFVADLAFWYLFVAILARLIGAGLRRLRPVRG
jgi:hypothetical protein